MKTGKRYFTAAELLLWLGSAATITLCAALTCSVQPLELIASLIGVTSLILNAKGNPVGQLLMLIFSVMYGIISLTCKYYGEMITYLGMTAPMALLALISWLKNPYNGNKNQVKVNKLSKREIIAMLIASLAVTAAFFPLLKALGTARLAVSIISVTTSFIAVYLTFRRSSLFALGYAANDLVLIALWGAATKTDSSYLSVLICFIVFFLNDVYGFISWKRMERSQARQSA